MAVLRKITSYLKRRQLGQSSPLQYQGAFNRLLVFLCVFSVPTSLEMLSQLLDSSVSIRVWNSSISCEKLRKCYIHRIYTKGFWVSESKIHSNLLVSIIFVEFQIPGNQESDINTLIKHDNHLCKDFGTWK